MRYQRQNLLLLSGVVVVELDHLGHQAREKVYKTEGEEGWTKLTKIKEMNKGEWAAQFLQLKVSCAVKVREFAEFTCIIKKTMKMKCLMKHFVEELGVPVARLRFSLDGQRLNGEETPETLEMEQDDLIELFGEQPWRE